jgi:hypothetical protein
MTRMMARRWGDNDTYFGPLTFARSHRGYRPTAIMLGSGDDEYPGASLRVSVLGATVILALPGWLVPAERTKVYPTSWDAATIQRLGRNWYWDVKRREFGFTLSEGHLSLHYGRQTHDSSTEKSRGWFLPWRSWRHVRHSLYDLTGAHFADMPHRWHLNGIM